MILLIRLKINVRKVVIFFCKICKMTNHNAKKYWHKGKPQINFCKKIAHIENDCWHKQQEQTNFFEEQRNKWKKIFSLLLNVMFHQKKQ